MNILIDIGHPAHVHYYRNLANELLQKGHKVVFTVKEIEVAKKLLEHYGISYTVFPAKKDGLIEKALRQILYNWKLWRICILERIDIAIGTSISVAHVSKISSFKSIIFDDDDDEVQPLVTRYVNPFADTLLSPEALKGKRKRVDTIYYPGYHELAYLHPRRFQPDSKVLQEAGVMEGEPFFILRFNVFKAHHDVGISGLTLQQKLELIEVLKPHGRIFITTEREIEPELKEYQLPVSPEKVHSLMAFASIFLGDSQTMTSEAAMLGVPSLRCNSFSGRISYLEEQEHRYGLTYAFLPKDFYKMLAKLRELLDESDLRAVWQTKRRKMLSEMIDVTAFWCWFIENYPESIDVMRENPDYPDRFK